MPVICADGLVGRVTEVGATWSKVTAVIDAETSVPVMVERTRDNCMDRGVLNTVDSEAGMELYYLPRDRTELVTGGTVITSGIGGIYPKGINIGSVREVLTADGEANAIISPSVDFVHIEEVFIITGNGEGCCGNTSLQLPLQRHFILTRCFSECSVRQFFGRTPCLRLLRH